MTPLSPNLREHHPAAPAIRVTHVVLSLNVGGLERVVLSLARGGLSRGQRVSVLCLEEPGGLADEVRATGVPVRALGKRPGFRVGMFKAIADALRDPRPDVVHVHQIGALFYAGPAARNAGVGAVLHTEHGKHFDGRPRLRWLARVASLSADRYCCVSGDIAASVRSHRVAPAGKVGVVANGIDTRRFAAAGRPGEVRRSLGIPADAPVVGTVANLREVKCQDVLIRGFAGVPHPGRAGRPHLLIVGDGPLRAPLGALAAALGVADRVHFAGAQNEPERFLAAMDVFALTSRSEGMPLSIIEAGAAGLPTVASRVGGVPELVRHGHNGLLFEAGDAAGLARHLGDLLGDPERAGRMGRAAQDDARRRFDVSAMSDNYHGQYLSLLAAAGRVPSPAGRP